MRPYPRARAWSLSVALSLASCTTKESPPTIAPAPEELLPAEPTAPKPENKRALQCPGVAPETYPWRSPTSVKKGACSDDELETLAAAISKKTVKTAEDIARTLGDTCAACAVGEVEDDSWRAIIAGHDGYLGNVGGCAIHLGASETCGQKIDALSSCLIVGCKACTTRKEQDKCADELTKANGACAEMLQTVRDECPAEALSDAFASSGTCQSMVETIRLFCGG